MEDSNKVVMNTGGSRGIGLALASHLSALGHQVIITGRNSSRLDEVEAQNQGRIAAIKADALVR